MKVLIVRFSSIGDIVLTSPVIRCVRQQTGAEVHFLTKESFKGILEANPYISKVFTIRRKIGEVANALRNEHYDAVIDLHHNLRTLQLRFSMPGTPFHAFDKANFKKWRMVRFKTQDSPIPHIVQRYLEAARPLGVQDDLEGLDYFIPAGQEVSLEMAAQLFPTESKSRALVKEGRYYAFAIGAAHATKRMPAEKIAEICRQLDAPIILLGGAADQQAALDILELCGQEAVASACGTLSLHQSASIVRQARRVIAHDTGLMHIAAALRKELISIWGNTVPEFGMSPYYPPGTPVYNRQVQVRGLPCRPCSKIGFENCPQGHFRCMNDIPALDVARAAVEPYNQAPPR